MKTSMISPVLMGVLLLAGPAYAGDDPKVAAEVMALARAQWAAEAAGKGMADPSSLFAAIRTCTQLARRRMQA